MDQLRENPRMHVVRFVEAFRRHSSSLLSVMPQLTELSDVIREVRGRRMPRRGALPNGLQYQVHGMGCVMTGVDGVVVNVDFLAEGRPVFDVTRLEDFVKPIDDEALISREEFLAACRSAAKSGLIEEVRKGWFAVLPASHSALVGIC